ncbi:MAG: hypothetical protein U1F50_04435 [Rubrivivax sp.]
MRPCLAVALMAPLLAAAAAAEDRPAPPEAAVQKQVSEDDNVRIEEVRVRGQTQSITVTSKIRGHKGSQYEIVPPSGARDPSVAGSSNGQRVWHVLSF